MKTFTHVEAKTIEEAVSSLGHYGDKAKLISGGTDLLGLLKDAVLPAYPEALVNIKTIPDMAYIREEGGTLKIGVMTTLNDLAQNPTVQSKYSALAQAARAVGSTGIRNMGTIGGNICQQVRCWYFRSSGNYFDCLRKTTGGACYALTGDHRYHSIFGAVDGCVAVNPSDTAPALVALGAKIKTNKRTFEAKDFFVPNGGNTHALEGDEVATEIQIPALIAGSKSAFVKFAIRKSIDFPIVNCAAVVTASGGVVSSARIVLNAVAGAPYQATEAETSLTGKAIDEVSAQAAGDAAVTAAVPLTGNKYLVQIARTMVKRAILACR
ncbi:MAG: FAD binding domain-containing protein [Dehalococcoidales bacterium]|jgi:xanthine dehydrogenase YagS FAD-binding subunit|nr:FAD binding domain-containing protein [Dehalococcoidales bacterium]MDD4322760.1 FAD binding domain-containing protein [Dehalococcoidales bacterium]MDD4635146.1 FAD binding domain-containing protein [Dehalococcoidales bacterium]NLE89869.1 molybdopterin dehydrogenase [Dehalococcoidales bacterium]